MESRQQSVSFSDTVAITAADRSLLGSGKYCKRKICSTSENNFKTEMKKAFKEKHLMKGEEWMYYATIINPEIKPLIRQRTFLQYPYGPLWQQTSTAI